MAVIPEIDVSPDTMPESEMRHQYLDERDAKKRAQVLVGTFLIVLIIGLSFVWLRSPVYQSSALLRFVYPDAVTLEQNARANQEFALSDLRLTSLSILSSLSESLVLRGVQLTPDELSIMLDSKVNAEQRLITLIAKNSHRESLTPLMENWLELFLAKYQRQQSTTSEKDSQLTEAKLLELEHMILQQRMILEQFSKDNDIISIESNENRILSKMQSVTEALNEAEQMQTKAAAQLAAIQQARIDGLPLVSSESRADMKLLISDIRALEQELEMFRRRYTEVYMKRDPAIVDKTKQLAVLNNELKMLVQSDDLFEEEIRQLLISAEAQVNELLRQRKILLDSTQEFSTILAQYRSKTFDVEQLELQAQKQRAALIDITITRPFEPRVDILEQPMTASSPIGPNYLRDSGLVFALAMLSAALALIIYKMVAVKRTKVTSMGASYTVIQSQDNTEPALSSPYEPQYISHQAQQAALSEPIAPVMTLGVSNICLNDEQNRALLFHLVDDGKLAMMLTYCGVAPDELMKLTLGQLDVSAGLIHIEGRYQRSLTMASDLQQMLGGFIEPDSEEHWLWRKPDGHVQTQSDISKMIHYAALDSGFENAELVDLNSLRHTYLKHLAQQGVRLNLLEKFAGYITPTQLSQYRKLAESGMTTELSELEMIHPSLSAKRER